MSTFTLQIEFLSQGHSTLSTLRTLDHTYRLVKAQKKVRAVAVLFILVSLGKTFVLFFFRTLQVTVFEFLSAQSTF